MVTRGESKVLGKKRKYRKYFEEEQEDNTELLPGLPSDATEEQEDNMKLVPGLPNDATLQLISTKFWLVFGAETRRVLRLTKILTMGESKVLGKKRKYFREEQEDNTELLPGLPNYVTVQLISTKLPWPTFHVLSSVSRAWLGVIRSGEMDDTELLPGLPNYVTVQLISTKLPWRTFHVLSSVSRAWLGAIRSGEINYARVRSRTAETLAVINFDTAIQDRHCRKEIALYSLRDKAFYRLPPLMRFEYGLPERCSYITTGGKIYILGGAMGAEVWVLDVAGQQKWQECASMHTPRILFECAAFEGKIYVFGGSNVRGQPIDSSEVYDPKVNAWTKISPMKSARVSHDAMVVRDEVLVHDGYVYDPNYYHGQYWRPTESSRDGIEAYNPAKDSWRTIPPGDFGKHEFCTNWWRPRRLGSFGKHDIRTKRERLFTAHGRLHSLTQRKIVVFDLDKKSVKGLHPCSVQTRSDICSPHGGFWPEDVLATDDGLLTIGRFEHGRPPFDGNQLYQSGIREFGMKIVLKEVECSPLIRDVWPVMRPIQL